MDPPKPNIAARRKSLNQLRNHPHQSAHHLKHPIAATRQLPRYAVRTKRTTIMAAAANKTSTPVCPRSPYRPITSPISDAEEEAPCFLTKPICHQGFTPPRASQPVIISSEPMIISATDDTIMELFPNPPYRLIASPISTAEEEASFPPTKTICNQGFTPPKSGVGEPMITSAEDHTNMPLFPNSPRRLIASPILDAVMEAPCTSVNTIGNMEATPLRPPQPLVINDEPQLSESSDDESSTTSSTSSSSQEDLDKPIIPTPVTTIQTTLPSSPSSTSDSSMSPTELDESLETLGRAHQPSISNSIYPSSPSTATSRSTTPLSIMASEPSSELGELMDQEETSTTIPPVPLASKSSSEPGEPLGQETTTMGDPTNQHPANFLKPHIPQPAAKPSSVDIISRQPLPDPVRAQLGPHITQMQNNPNKYIQRVFVIEGRRYRVTINKKRQVLVADLGPPKEKGSVTPKVA